MTCSDVNHYFDRSAQTRIEDLPAGVREHLRVCQTCRALWEFMASGEPAPVVDEQARGRIEESLARSLQPVRPLTCGWKFTIAFASVALAATVVYVALVGTEGITGQRALQFGGMLGLLGSAKLLLAGSLSREMTPGERRMVDPGILFLILAAAFGVSVVMLFPWRIDPSFLAASWHCFKAGLFLSIPTAGLMVLLLRRGTVLSPGIAGAAVGMLSGLVSITVLHFGCDIHNAPHIAFSHLGIAAIGALAGWLLGTCLPLLRSRPAVDR